jgi:hypothetical protein
MEENKAHRVGAPPTEQLNTKISIIAQIFLSLRTPSTNNGKEFPSEKSSLVRQWQHFSENDVFL